MNNNAVTGNYQCPMCGVEIETCHYPKRDGQYDSKQLAKELCALIGEHMIRCHPSNQNNPTEPKAITYFTKASYKSYVEWLNEIVACDNEGFYEDYDNWNRTRLNGATEEMINDIETMETFAYDRCHLCDICGKYELKGVEHTHTISSEQT